MKTGKLVLIENLGDAPITFTHEQRFVPPVRSGRPVVSDYVTMIWDEAAGRHVAIHDHGKAYFESLFRKPEVH